VIENDGLVTDVSRDDRRGMRVKQLTCGGRREALV